MILDCMCYSYPIHFVSYILLAYDIKMLKLDAQMYSQNTAYKNI